MIDDMQLKCQVSGAANNEKPQQALSSYGFLIVEEEPKDALAQLWPNSTLDGSTTSKGKKNV